MDCSLPHTSAHRVVQARVLEWGAIAFSRKEAHWLYFTLNSDTHSSVQFSDSVMSISLCPMDHSMPGLLSITISRSLPKPMSIELVMPSNHLILCCPLLLLPSNFPSIRVFSNESVLHIKWPKYWCFSFNISPSSEYSELISFRMDWLDLRPWTRYCQIQT